MPLLNTAQAYGTLPKILHWLLVVLLLAMVISGQTMGVNENIQAFHEILGKVILGLATLRLALRLAAPVPRPNPAHKTWEVRLARFIHWGFYLSLFALPISGWVMVSAGDFAMTGALPAWLAPYALEPVATSTHKFFKIVLLTFAALHSVGALKHLIIDRDDTFARIWFGK